MIIKIQIMDHRDILKNIIKFGRREFNEKKPISLRILRVKSKSILKRGMLPSLNIKQVQGIFFLAVLDYKVHLRIYFFNKEGQLIGGENFDKKAVFMKKLAKETTLEYKLPKEKPTFDINDITSYFRKQFNKFLQNMNNSFGMDVKLPIIIARQGFKLQMGRTIGCAVDKDKKALIISPEAYKRDIFEIIVIREIMYLYLKDLIVLFQIKEAETVFWYDLAILFTNFYLRNEKNEYISNLMKNSTKSFLAFNDDEKYYFSDKVLEILGKNKEIYTINEINILFKNIFSCLKILKDYGIRLQNREFANFFFTTCDLFSGKDSNFHHSLLKINYYDFLSIPFKKCLKKNKNSKKERFLDLIFNILSLKSIKIKNLSDLLKEINILSKDKILQEEIIDHQKLTNDALIVFIFNYIININLDHKIKDNHIELCVNIENKGDYIFQDFKYTIKWKPNNRVIQTSEEDLIKSRDLHATLKRQYSFSIESKGTLSFFITIMFSNPINKNFKLKKVIKFDKIKIYKNNN